MHGSMPLEPPTGLHLQHLWVQLCHPQTSFFTWQGCNLWKVYSLVNHLNINSSKGPQTSLVSSHLLSVAMTSFRSAASLTLEPLMNIFSRRESYSFLAWKRNNWRLSKASTSESVNQNFRLARLFVLYTKDMQSNCCTKEGFDSFLWWWWWWWCLIWHLAVLESCWFQTTVEPPLTANSPQWPPLYNGHCTYLCPGRQAINCFLFKPLNNGHLLTTATVPLKHVPNCQFFSVSDEKVKNDHDIWSILCFDY